MLSSILYHGDDTGDLWTWTWEPSVLAGLTLISIGYLLLAGPLRKRLNYGPPVSKARIAAFLGGNLIVFIAMISPLDHLADDISFSAHMVQHILLMEYAPVLWLAGLPDGLMNAIFRSRFLRRALHEVTRPAAAFLIFNGVMLIWHIPGFYNAALENEPVHIIQHLSFMATAVIGWWPVLGNFPEAASRAKPPIQLFYLFLMMFPSTALAAWVALSPNILFPFYGDFPELLGLSAYDDQQLSGLIMWIPGNALFFAVFSRVFFRWFQQSSRSGESRQDMTVGPANTHKE
jgi:cytochrome c oxidase assembly factor CtaG